MPVDLSSPVQRPDYRRSIGEIFRDNPLLVPVHPSNSVLYNPGYHACFDYAGGISSGRFTGGDQALINSLATGPSDNVLGLSWIIDWLQIDKGVSSASFDWTLNDLYVNAARAKGKRWWCWVAPFFLDPSGNSSCSTGKRTVPQWVYNASVAAVGNCSQAQGNMLDGNGDIGGGCYPKYYMPVCQSAIIQLYQAFINRYGSDPLCEGLIFSIGSSIVVANQVDNLCVTKGVTCRQPAGINYDAPPTGSSNYSDAKMQAAYITFMQAWRSMTPTLNLHMSLDYMFFQGDSQPSLWQGMMNAIQANQCIGGGPDCLSKNWVYPCATPAISGFAPGTSFCLTPQPDSRFATTQNLAARNNSCFTRGVSSDQYLVGWHAFAPYKGLIKWGKTQELTEMGGYIGQFAASDVMQTSGSSLYNVHYQHFDINYSQSGNYGLNISPNTLWLANAAYESAHGPSVYTYIKANPFVAPPNPYP